MPLTIDVTGRSLARAGKVLALPTVPARSRPTVGAGADVLDTLEVDARAALGREEAKGDAGEVVAIPVGRKGVDTVLLAGIGDGSRGRLVVELTPDEATNLGDALKSAVG